MTTICAADDVAMRAEVKVILQDFGIPLTFLLVRSGPRERGCFVQIQYVFPSWTAVSLRSAACASMFVIFVHPNLCATVPYGTIDDYVVLRCATLFQYVQYPCFCLHVYGRARARVATTGSQTYSSEKLLLTLSPLSTSPPPYSR